MQPRLCIAHRTRSLARARTTHCEGPPRWMVDGWLNEHEESNGPPTRAQALRRHVELARDGQLLTLSRTAKDSTLFRLLARADRVRDDLPLTQAGFAPSPAPEPAPAGPHGQAPRLSIEQASLPETVHVSSSTAESIGAGRP